MAGLVEGKRISGSFLPRDDDGRVRMFAGYVTGNICSACGKDGAYECKECKAVGFCHPGCPEYKRIEDDHNQVCHDMGMAMSDKSQAHHNPVDPLVPTSDAPKHWGALKDWSTWGKKRINMAATTVEKSGSTMRVSARAVSPVMTVWSAMGLMGIRTHNKSYVIHVLGPDDRHELMWDMKPWRELASMMPDSPSVTIEFIGPAVPAEKTGTTHEPPLHRRLTINYHQMYYQAYVGTDAALEPDLVFIAHSALHEPEHQATWQPAVRHCIHEVSAARAYYNPILFSRPPPLPPSPPHTGPPHALHLAQRAPPQRALEVHETVRCGARQALHRGREQMARPDAELHLGPEGTQRRQVDDPGHLLPQQRAVGRVEAHVKVQA